jgi:multidrug efflux pump subunit AcrA (membrane-fusion protein)
MVGGKQELTPGTRVKLQLTLAEKEAIRLPLRALQKAENGWQVYVVENGRAVARQVAVQEPVSGTSVALQGGVKEGERVIVDGTDFIAEGMAVNAVGSAK